jgi:O-methyltransferase
MSSHTLGQNMAALVKNMAGKFGLDIRRADRLFDLDDSAVEIIERVQPYSMTSPERIFALVQAVRYISDAAIPGSIVEAGVWRGGSAMAAAMELMNRSEQMRDLYLYDTYKGMSEPTKEDVDMLGRAAKAQRAWAYSPIEDVRRNLLSTGYPAENLHFVKGNVEDTIPGEAPERIALLRLDTDWYTSTKHEMEHLYPRLVSGGVLIIDDYGYWEGARQAVDEYIVMHDLHLLLNRIDTTGRIALKP